MQNDDSVAGGGIRRLVYARGGRNVKDESPGFEPPPRVFFLLVQVVQFSNEARVQPVEPVRQDFRVAEAESRALAVDGIGRRLVESQRRRRVFRLFALNQVLLRG